MLDMIRSRRLSCSIYQLPCMSHLEPLSFLISTDRSIGPAAIAECNKAAVEQNRSFIEGILLSMCLYFMIKVLHGGRPKRSKRLMIAIGHSYLHGLNQDTKIL